MKKAIAIIPARGGSKRIPKKNIKDFCGKPIVAYSITAAVQSKAFDEVMVSTDDSEIADLAVRYGACVPFLRSEKTAGDYATTAQVVMEVLDEYKKLGKEYDHAFCLYPTAPFVDSELILKAENLMKEKSPDEIIAVTEFSYPPQRCYCVDADGLLTYKYKEYIDMRSQDLEKLYHDAGQFYIYNVKALSAHGGRIQDKIMPIVLPAMLVQDIDTIEDWTLAELKYNYWKKNNQ